MRLMAFYMLVSRRHGPGPVEALVRRGMASNEDRPLPVVPGALKNAAFIRVRQDRKRPAGGWPDHPWPSYLKESLILVR
jgi:hypothetical protein